MFLQDVQHSLGTLKKVEKRCFYNEQYVVQERAQAIVILIHRNPNA